MVGPDEPLTRLPGVGPKRARALAEAGFRRLTDLLWHLPRVYEDRRSIVSVGAVRGPGEVQVAGRVEGLCSRHLRGRRALVEGVVRDSTGTLAVVWFNQSWLPDRLEGRFALLHGHVSRDRAGELTLRHPAWELGSEVAVGRLVAVYSTLGEIGSGRFAGWIDWILDQVDLADALPDRVPASVLARRGLPSLAEAVRLVHRPPADADLGQLRRFETAAQRRIAYGELYRQQLTLARRARDRRAVRKRHRYRVDDDVRVVARKVLPFRLTGAQRRVLGELVGDLQADRPMRRLLQGDVGSGKTIVAAMLVLIAAESGLQSAVMAPTEILAEQHVGAFRRLFGSRYRVGLFTGSRRSSGDRQALARGEVTVAIGTHALLEEAVAFDRLALVVIDEQHRFGVGQRALMTEKGGTVDALVMSATPIPRSVALTAYGDLDVSVLDEKPGGRLPVETRVEPSAKREEVYERLGRTLQAGDRAYVVFPFIDNPDGEGLAALSGLGDEIRARFSDVPSAVVHGRLTAAEREARVDAFRRGDVRLLLATTVIEVGVDVPEATAMVIESAERFGLAQLHQLRGRVGRSDRPSWCCAVHGRLTEAGSQRLAVFSRCLDGFEVAEQDLMLRGPGELLGSRQSGADELRIADIVRDRELLFTARHDACQTAEEE